MIGSFAQFRGEWKRPVRLRQWFVGWIVAEILVFALALKLFGIALTLFAMIGSSVVGLSILRRLGRGAVQHVRGALGGREDLLIDGTLTALGAFLLILPGFVSAAVGLALVSPSLRRTLVERVLPNAAPQASPRRKVRPDVIDLAPEDWRVVDRTGSRSPT